jgi:hypothetical protein
LSVGGTSGSNPLSSSAESANCQSLPVPRWWRRSSNRAAGGIGDVVARLARSNPRPISFNRRVPTVHVGRRIGEHLRAAGPLASQQIVDG